LDLKVGVLIAKELQFDPAGAVNVWQGFELCHGLLLGLESQLYPQSLQFNDNREDA
jgi:hypothetical protein